MDWYKALTVLLFGLSLAFCSHAPLREYYYISSSPKTWQDAQLYCREKYTDLATFESMEDINQLSVPAGISWLWIGLQDLAASWMGTLGNDSNSWKWSTTGQPITSQYHHWVDGQTTYIYADQVCVVMDGTDGKWTNLHCDQMRPFVCYTDGGQNHKTYVLVSTRKTWSDAQSYCRQHHTDLAVITSSEEDSSVLSLIGASSGPWIGLSRVPWAWSDKSPSTFRHWKPGQPNHYETERCGCLNGDKQWADGQCQVKKYFICSEVVKSKTRVMMQMKTTGDLTDPAVAQGILQKINASLSDRRMTDHNLQWTRHGKPQRKLP